MISFSLPMNAVNLKIARFYEDGEHVKVAVSGNKIVVNLTHGLTIFRIDVEGIARAFTDKEWRDLAEQIKSTLKGAKIREFTDLAIGIQPLRSKDIHLRINPIEFDLIRNASREDHRSISDFIRMAALEKAEQVLEIKSEFKKRLKLESKRKLSQETEIYG